MRTTSIPAQITTVEDKIAGNLNLAQIVLLLTPVFLSTVIYAVLPIRLHFTSYKVILMALTTVVFLFLSLRIKERVVLNWIIILASYWLRPHLYLFNKNDVYLRDLVLDLKPKVTAKRKRINHAKSKSEVTNLSEDIQKLGIKIGVNKPRLNFRFNRKGALVVQAYE